jgi:hypothetical protein
MTNMVQAGYSNGAGRMNQSAVDKEEEKTARSGADARRVRRLDRAGRRRKPEFQT